ncbi:nucleoside deaminase [Maribacter sp. 2304DJ31-5]|uniref:nucleoside deaminase n=1 Tax=Maribacter sp. 2304DJ31-5 TaxID=3386273 RepID=UPI0039BD86D5
MNHKNIREKDKFYMRHCITLAKEALKTGNSPVGSVVVHQDTIIGEGVESSKSTKDVTDHAEILAVRDAISKEHLNNLGHSTLYTTHEPCVMCSYLIRHHKIPRIVYGITVEDIGGASSKFNLLCTTEVTSWDSKPEIIGGFLKEECENITV